MVFSEPVEIEGCLDFPLMTFGGFRLSCNFYVHMRVSFTHVNKTETMYGRSRANDTQFYCTCLFSADEYFLVIPKQ